MNYGKNADGTERTRDEWRVAVATKVLGWKLVSPHGISLFVLPADPNLAGQGAMLPADFNPDRSADDDRLVLAVVRTWKLTRKQFWEGALFAIREKRSPGTIEEWYEPGDWSAAALAVVEQQEVQP